MYLDFSSPRLDDYLRQDAKLWTEYMACRIAAERGSRRVAEDEDERRRMEREMQDMGGPSGKRRNR